MKTLTVGLGKNSYDIIIGSDFYNDFPTYIKNIYPNKDKKLFVITDNNVNKIYRDYYDKFFKSFQYDVHVLQAGEKHKHFGVLPNIYKDLVEKGYKRNDLIIAFGGGVVGDIAGFIAATYLRGIDFIQIPTTIISQVDSSVGGKVGVDLPEGKNLVGAFYQPKLVLIDNYFLNTLEDRYFFDGFAEIVKYGCIYDKNLFEKLENVSNIDENSVSLRETLMKHINELVYRSCEIKKEVVEKDEKENSLRMILNFGHTIGHAIEQYTNYEVYSHGEAISTGMIDIIKSGEKLSITKSGENKRVEKLLNKLKLPTNINYPIDEIKTIMQRDKKSVSDGINFVFLNEIGSVSIIKKSVDEIF